MRKQLRTPRNSSTMAKIITITNREIDIKGRLMMRIEYAEAQIDCSDTILRFHTDQIRDDEDEEDELGTRERIKNIVCYSH